MGGYIFDIIFWFAAKGGVTMAADQNRVTEVHIGLYPEYVYYVGEPSEAIYAGSIVDSRECPSAVDGYGSIPFSFIRVPRIIGTKGVIVFQECADRIYWAAIAVPEKYFGTGIAEMLLDRLESIASERGKAVVAGTVWPSNTRSRRFVLKHSYAETRTLPSGMIEVVRRLEDPS